MGHDGHEYNDFINPRSLEVLKGCKMEPGLGAPKPFDRLQLERLGYFCVDPASKPGSPVLNRTTRLKDAWEKKKQQAAGGPKKQR